MKSTHKRRTKVIVEYTIGWTLAFLFLSIVRGAGTEELGALRFDMADSLLLAITIGPIIGAISGYFEFIEEERIFKRVSIKKLLFLRTIYGIFFLLVLIVVSYAVYQLFFGTEVDIVTFALDDGSFVIYFYVIMVDLFLNLLRQVNLMLGPGNLLKLLRGDFYTPKEESRIFMFLDLKDSTTIAEKLGHFRYSSLIQECFNDLAVVADYDARIEQYVGDEAVLTWSFKEGLKNQHCIKAYYAFKNVLNAKRAHYIQQYGTVPIFKAGLHGGMVTVTEVGKYKKEISYHGDTVNTAARIQGQCSPLKKELLISEVLMEKLLPAPESTFQALGSIPLKGKENSVSIFAVTEN